MKYLSSFAFAVLFCAVADFAYASDGHELPWGNFALRMLNVAIFLGILWYAVSKLVKTFLARNKAQLK
ncbi:MAG: F0F1 ATP synthase subunit B, partial [Mailhella sp.]|nr:F0F1 ATP synthase subunit B [Mailhella sp.]